MLNNILTGEPALRPLENEFLKRGIGAIRFKAAEAQHALVAPGASRPS